MTGFDEHRARHPLFHQNTFIQEMADKYRWTISVPTTKMPINIRAILNGEEKIFGAKHYDERNLATLQELTDASPDIINCAIYLNSQTDNYVCLDIEKTCPKKIKNQFLKMPYIYGETSMSGEGVHLIFKIPDDWYTNDNYKTLREKTVSKEKHGYFELLTSHFVTLTRNMLPESKGTKSWTDFLAEFNKTQKPNKKITRCDDYKKIDLSNIPMGQEIVNRLVRILLKKDIGDYANDYSRYEFAVASVLNARMKDMLASALIQKNGHNYTHLERCTILYAALSQKLEHRDRHDELRNGIPYLYYTAENCILKSED